MALLLQNTLWTASVPLAEAWAMTYVRFDLENPRATSVLDPWASYLTSRSVFSSTGNLLYLRFAGRRTRDRVCKVLIHFVPTQLSLP